MSDTAQLECNEEILLCRMSIATNCVQPLVHFHSVFSPTPVFDDEKSSQTITQSFLWLLFDRSQLQPVKWIIFCLLIFITLRCCWTMWIAANKKSIIKLSFIWLTCRGPTLVIHTTHTHRLTWWSWDRCENCETNKWHVTMQPLLCCMHAS